MQNSPAIKMFSLRKNFYNAIFSYLRIGLLMAIISNGYSHTIDDLPWLPANESEAQRMIKDGTLDSLVWDQIRFYYIQPISVPYGELYILHQVFHCHFDSLPLDRDQLNKYDPWDNSKVDQFFRDYPFLVKYAAILEFPQRKMLRIGRTGFFLDQSGISQNSYGSRFSLGEKTIKFDGNVCFTEQLSRWKNRKFMISPADWGSVQFGNFCYNDESELVYGYFPSGLKTDSSVYKNWLYGNARSWNGISLELKNINILRRIDSKLHLYYHERLEEKSYGFQSELKAGPFKLNTGISSLFIPSVLDSFYYFHCSAEYLISDFNLQLQSDFNFQKKLFPLLFSVDCKRFGSLFKADFYYFPSGFYAPRSAILNRIDENVEDTSGCGGSVFFFRFRSSHSILENIFCLPEISIKLKNGIPETIKSSTNISGSWNRLDYNFRYAWMPLTSDSTGYQRHQFSANFSSRIGIFKLCLNNSYKIYEEKQSFYCFVSSEMNYSKVLEITPFFSVAKNKTDDYCLGIKEKLVLFEKNSIEFQIKQSLPPADQEGCNVQCNAWFLF
jgi:hypothetical protein